jgi:hypothetical protein
MWSTDGLVWNAQKDSFQTVSGQIHNNQPVVDILKNHAHTRVAEEISIWLDGLAPGVSTHTLESVDTSVVDSQTNTIVARAYMWPREGVGLFFQWPVKLEAVVGNAPLVPPEILAKLSVS